jgi:hypothetical protein
VGGVPAQDDWNKLDMPGLRGISNTAPYFHNNSAATLEEVVDHYIEFFKRVKANAPPGVVPPIASTDGVNFDRQPLAEEREALLAYLRKLWLLLLFKRWKSGRIWVHLKSEGDRFGASFISSRWPQSAQVVRCRTSDCRNFGTGGQSESRKANP